MKFQEALDQIVKNENGFMVTFDYMGIGVRETDSFPDKKSGEKLIPTEKEAWVFAERFANATEFNYNIHVVDCNYNPVNTCGHLIINHKVFEH